jgi:hypothetical protein
MEKNGMTSPGMEFKTLGNHHQPQMSEKTHGLVNPGLVKSPSELGNLPYFW